MTQIHAPLTGSGELAARYLHWGVVQISLANLLVIAAMVAVFVLALVLPFPGSHEHDGTESDERR